MDLTSIIKSLNPPGKILFAKIAGSHSHNTAVPTSDIDALGVYVAPTDLVLGMDPPPETITNSTNDFTVHEVAKFCRLLIKGNPNIVEMLFTEKMCKYEPAWMELYNQRRRFLSARAVEQYIGYLLAQLHKLSTKTYLHTAGGKYNTKFGYHLVRLGYDGLRMSKGEGPVVWKEDEEREVLMKIRTGETSEEEVARLGNQFVREIDALKPWKLPEEGDKILLNDWLVSLRKTDVGPILEGV